MGPTDGRVFRLRSTVHESKRNAKHPSHDFHRDTTLGDEESNKGGNFYLVRVLMFVKLQKEMFRKAGRRCPVPAHR